MVASSRSSLRRPNMRGDHQSPMIHDAQQPSEPVSPPPLTRLDTNFARAKRTRVSSVSDRDRLQKRRRIASRLDTQHISIPLRGKLLPPESVTPAPVTPSVPETVPPLLSQNSSLSNSPLESPAIRPQYDQFKRIEEKAQKAIHRLSNIDNAGKDERRKLRSEHGSSRAKTELAQYFPGFDEMLSLEPPDPSSLTPKTNIVLIDDTQGFKAAPGRPDPFGATKPLHRVEFLDLAQYVSEAGPITHDPLGPDVFAKAHHKAERHEKQMKNGDKERAQHEKYQLERLLEELRGPDWLKTLGITGITDTEKKRYEPKRALFIRETRALIDKFKRWKEEEKRRKAERQQAMVEDTEGGDHEEDRTASTSTRRPRRQATSRNRSRASSRPASLSDKGPDSSELDALASQQLLEEAKSANIRKKRVSLSEPVALLPPEILKPFTSFFKKPHLREAAVQGRQRGRTVLAFGHPIPDMAEADFELPENILTEDAIRASQRSRRRVRRHVDE